MSAPYRYIHELGTYSCDIRELYEKVKWIEYSGGKIDAIVFGGGGLIHRHSYDIIGNKAFAKYKRLMIGAGNNMGLDDKWEYPSFLEEFDYVGLRDPENPYRWLPCASCLHPRFKRWSKKKEGTVMYGHYDYEIPNPDFVTYLDNRKKDYEFLGVIEHLDSASKVFTNSWHGYYWATLLNSNPELFRPFSNRFDCFNDEYKELWEYDNCLYTYITELKTIKKVLAS